jgi:hypothetical protein
VTESWPEAADTVCTRFIRTHTWHAGAPGRDGEQRTQCARGSYALTRGTQVHPGVTESWPEAPENQGRSADELRADQRLHALDRFHTIALPDEQLAHGTDWWHVGADRNRYACWVSECANTPTLGAPRYDTAVFRATLLHSQLHFLGRAADRYARFLEAIAGGTAQRIVVVCHYGFIHQLLHEAGAGQHHLQNCQWARAVWSC